MPSAPPPDWIRDHRRTVGARIRAARLHANLTQEKLGELAGMDRQAINRIEQGHQSPILDNLVSIARAVGADPGDLIKWPATGPGDDQ
ncbi:helix-turn-helix domain-containing protein [Streptomyces sp. NPDC058762]|uniref:helix-turn-helix domain-containing protein n=1 Tax=Streptomyces sp. NPDC058762 TaxID=3346629 RepID=UPI0036A3D10B